MSQNLMAYERHGAGEPLVLIHGIGHNRKAWSHMIPHLARYFDVIAVDLPGHGDSAALDLEGRDIAEVFRAEFLALFDSLGIDKPHVVGNSLGGRIALELASYGDVRGATAISPAGFWASSLEFLYTEVLFASVVLAAQASGPLGNAVVESPIGRNALKIFMERPARLDRSEVSGMLNGFRKARPALKSIIKQASKYDTPISADIPVTVVWGTRDHVLPYVQSARARKVLPNASHVSLQDCGHVPMSDAPALISHIVLADSAKSRVTVAA
ncbi:alpha/beta fold hydrolase [Smaragdicoccus niigatensis]|uniref:alpha/beta fold hydrolase n=1 Tax=Smaragdicoccus niigatensis TaxID=359359 RepID=UPI001FDFBEAE|nr:alpha/beta hydrolase [Smaragdicoccus niigatensis]